jgi:hypothetical protein
MHWTEIYDATFWLAVGSIVAGSFGLTIKYCLKSKCSTFSLLWGLIRIERDIQAEKEIELKQIEEGVDKPAEPVSEKKENS